MPASTTTSTTGGGTVTSFSNTPQAKDDVFNLTEDTVSLVASPPTSTIISLDVMANDGGGAAKSLYSIDDGESASTATKTYAPIDLTKAETWTAGVSAWEPSGTPGILIRLNALTGKVEMDLTGYLAANGFSSLQAMGAGDSIHESFTYAIRLANGTLSWAKAEVHITGANDAAVITGQCSAELTESDLPQATGGKLNVSDIDGADVFIPQTGVAGTNGYGTFSIDENGNWTYLMNSAHNEFKAGIDYTDSATVQAADGTTKVITVTIHGTNDAPELTGTQATLASGTEEQQYTISEADLLAGFTDAESDALSVANLSADNGTLHDNGDGTWTFTPNGDFHGTVTLNYDVIDGNGGSVAATQTFGIANVDDEATGNLALDGIAEEGGSLTASLTDLSDIDGPATATGYQWQEKIDGIWTDIVGQDGETLNIPDDQSYVGKEVRVIVTTTDALGGQTEFTSDSQTIANVEDEATGTVAVTGQAEEGGALSADATGLSDEDGGIASTTFQWQEKVGDDWVDIGGQDGETLNIPGDQSYVGKEVRVVATTTDALGGTTATPSAEQVIANVEDEATGSLAITGDAEEGGTLTADTSGLSDDDGGVTFAYQWQLDGVDIGGATSDTLNVPSDQSYVGHEVILKVTTTDAFGGTTDFSTSTTIANVEDEATGKLAISGDAEEGGTLTADTSGLSDDDGGVTFAYQWQLDGVDIGGATTDTLNVPSDQSYVGHEVTLKVTTTDAFGGTSDFSTSTTIANVEDEATGSLAITGDAEEGGTLTADTSGLSDDDGGVTFAYQWQLDGVDIGGATSDTLNVPSDQSYVGHEVILKVTTTDAFGGTTDFSTSATIANVEDEAVGTLAISGVAEEGGTLTADTSGLSDADGGISFAYQWQLDGVDISGATSDTLSVPDDQSYVGHEVTLKVTTTDAFGGTTNFSTSTTIANVEDEATGTVGVTGAAEEGGALTADASGIVDEDGGVQTTTYQWQEKVGESWVDIGGQSNATLSIPSDQSYVGKEVRAVATTTDAFGGTTSIASVSQVIANVNDAPSVSLINTIASTPENGGVIKVADIVVSDVDGGTNVLSLSGADMGSFTIVGTELRFNGGADFESKASYDVTVNVNDATVGGNPDGSANLNLAITDVVETVPASLPSTSAAADPNDFDSIVGNKSPADSTGGTGNDTLTGNGSPNAISGGAGNDVIYGVGNGDTLTGGTGNDSIYGQAGNDSISGSEDNDTLFGGSGVDTLNGNDGNDSIFAGSGNDVIDGGTGMDTIVGGTGADTINLGAGDGVADLLRYLSVLDTNDSISGFVSGTDKIDLSAINSGDADQVFNWGGQETGPVVEANSVTWYTTGGNVVVLADTDGNLNTAEFSVTLLGITTITSGDVIL